MKLTALEIKKHEFGRAFRGYDPEEVDAFLNVVAQHWQSLNEDMRRLEERLEEQGQRVSHYQKVEEALEHALENAREMAQKRLDEAEGQAAKIADAADASSRKTVGDAQEEADRLLADAEQRSHALVESAERRLADLSSEVDLARVSAIRDFDALSKDRTRVLSGFREFLMSELDALERYDSRQDASIGTFSPGEGDSGVKEKGMADAEAAGTPAAGAAGLVGAEGTLDAESKGTPHAESTLAPAAAPAPRDVETSSAREGLEAAPEPSGSDDIQSPNSPSGPLGATMAGGFAFELEMDGEATAPDTTVEQIHDSALASDAKGGVDRLPTADESFESGSVAGESQQFELREAQHPESAQDDSTESQEPFGAEEEIRKIRRILEDLDD